MTRAIENAFALAQIIAILRGFKEKLLGLEALASRMRPWQGAYRKDRRYGADQICFYAGSSWIATRENKGEIPGTSDAWDLFAKHGKEGRPGNSPDAPTSADIQSEVSAFLQPRMAMLRGKPGQAPSRVQILDMLRQIVEENSDQFKGDAGKDGIGIADMRMGMDSILRVRLGRSEQSADGRVFEFGPFRPKEPQPQKESEPRIAVVGGGLSETRVLELIEGFKPVPDTSLAHPFTATAADETPIINPSDPSKALRVHRISALNDPDEEDSVSMSFFIGDREIARGFAVQQSKVEEGAAGEALKINLEAAGRVDGTIHYEEFTP